MRKNKLYNCLPIALLLLSACNDETEADLSWLTSPEEKMELTASAEEIELDRNKPNDVVLTFNWTPAREMPEDYVISYVTKLDVEGHNFETCIRTDESINTFSKEYTTEELQRLLTEKWGQDASKVVPLQFRVIAKWDGGTRYAKPEVRDVTVNVRPYRPLVFEADKILIQGSSTDGDDEQMSKLLENEYQYAFCGDLKTGDIQIALQKDGGVSYIQLADGVENWIDGEEVAVQLSDVPESLTLGKDGEYRVVLDTEKKTMKIFSPDKKLLPLEVDWLNGDKVNEHTVITNLWLHGDINNWKTAVDGEFTPSLADPQILVSKKSTIGGQNMKFIVNPSSSHSEKLFPNNAWAFSPKVPDDKVNDDSFKQTLTLNKGVWTEMGSGTSRPQRNSQFKLPGNIKLIVLDLRNNKIFVN